MPASHFVQLGRFESVGFVNVNFAKEDFESDRYVNANFAKEDRLADAANHELDSVSNKSHSAHNWHLCPALMQAINVSWYQPVCRENPFDRLPKLWRLQSPPDFAVSYRNVTSDYNIIAIQCSA